MRYVQHYTIIPLRVALAALLLSFAATVCAQSTSGAIATVNGVAIPQSALESAISAAKGQGTPETPELRQTLKQQLIAHELFRQEAQKKGLASDPEVQRIAREASDNAMIQKYLRQAIQAKPVTDAQVRQYYDHLVSQLGPQEYKSHLIRTTDEASARLVLTELKSGKPFEDLARRHSKASSAPAGGAIEWVSFKTPPAEGQTQGFPLPLAQAVVKMKPGMVTAEPIAFKGSWFVLRLDEVRPTQITDYEQMKPGLRQALERQETERATAALVGGLIKAAKIEQ